MAELDQFALHPPVPQRGLSVAMRITSLRIAAAVDGRWPFQPYVRQLHDAFIAPCTRRLTCSRSCHDLPGWQNALVSTTAATAIRPAWDQLPAPLRDGLDARLGGITATRAQPGGFTPGLAVRLQLADGSRVFAKGIPIGHVLAGKYLEETATCRQLPAAAPAPRLRWNGQIDGRIVPIFDDIDGRHPVLAPGSPDTGRVVAMTAGLAAILTPCPVAAAPPASRRTGRAGLRLARTGR